MARQSTPEAPISEVPADETAAAVNAEVAANGSTPDATTGEAPKPKARQSRNTYTIPVTIPTALYDLLKAKAAETTPVTTAMQIARKLLADYVGYTLPLTPARAPKRKFATKEDAVAFRKDRNARAKALLAALDAGEVDEAMLARFLAAQGNGAVAPVAASESEAASA